jgi:hypothetical protein
MSSSMMLMTASLLAPVAVPMLRCGGAAALGADPAGLDAHLVQPAAGWPSLPEPPWRERSLDTAWEEEVSQRAGDAKAFEGLPLAFPTAVAQLDGGLAHRVSHRWSVWESPLDHGLGGTVVAVDM